MILNPIFIFGSYFMGFGLIGIWVANSICEFCLLIAYCLILYKADF